MILEKMKRNKNIKKMYYWYCRKIISILSKISPRIASKKFYNRAHKNKINLKKPKLFNEKLVYLKLKNMNNELIIKCTDKFLVREYLEEKGYSNLLNDLIGVYDSFDEIDWDSLPKKFALKCNHGCGYNIICSDKSKLDKIKTKATIDKWMNEKYGLESAEFHYQKIKPKIICEKFIDMGNDRLPTDYKVYCFNGKARIILVMNDREEDIKKEFYDSNWNLLHLRDGDKQPKILTKKPENLKYMLKCAEDLSRDFDFVRVDFYNVNNKLIFGELTFTPAGCNGNYTEEADKMLGDMLEIRN